MAVRVNDVLLFDRDDVLKRIAAEFVKRDPDYDAKRKPVKKRLNALGDQLVRMQKQGQALPCSEQLFLQAKWLTNYTDDWQRATATLDALEASLSQPQQPALVQGPDGSWAPCTDEWYRKLEPTVDVLQSKARPTALHALSFMAQLQSADWTLDDLRRLQLSDIRNTGRNQRDELGALQTALSQLVFKPGFATLFAQHPELGFAVSAEMKARYGSYLQQMQDPRTGYWGPSYVLDGQDTALHDLSFTFHIVHFNPAVVRNWPAVIDTTLAIKSMRYPAGWKPDDATQYSDHNNYDVVVIFRAGWPAIGEDRRAKLRPEIQAMLDWCLTKSLKGDGFDLAGNSPVDAYYYGVRFLDEAGLWDEAPFWGKFTLPADTPSPHDLCRKLRKGFDRFDDRSDEADKIKDVLDHAIASTAAGMA